MRSSLLAFAVTVVACTLLLAACFNNGTPSGSYDGSFPDVLLPGQNLPDAGTKRYSVGGTVDGLQGSGLVLEGDGVEPVSVSPSGGGPVSFTFQTLVPSGTPYTVVVKTQPSNPTQKCTVFAGSGHVPRSNVIGIVVNCSTTGFVVGGTVTGVQDIGLLLNDNGADTIAINGDGTFAFPALIPSNSNYAVTVAANPPSPSETCTVAQGSGTVTTANVTNVSVNCVPNTFSIGGTVVGLTGSGLVLTDNTTDNLNIAANGPFTFGTKVTSGSPFAAAIKTQPSNPTQLCTIAGATGTVTGGNVSGIVVNCSVNTFTVSGTVSGLAGAGLVLNTSAGPLTIGGNGGFALPASLTTGAAYSVAIGTPPTNPTQTCNVTGGSGTIAGANVTDVVVQCLTSTYTVGGRVLGLAAGSSLVVSDDGGDDLTIDANGIFTFATPLSSGSGYAVAIQTQPSAQTCMISSGGSGVVTNANITGVGVQCCVGLLEMLGGNCCTPGTTECTSDTQVAACDANGQWDAATTCMFACVNADVGVGGNCGGVCVPGTTQCTSDTQVETCNTSGQWGPPTTCTDACVGEVGSLGGNCGGVCVPASQACFSATQVETCGTNGQYDPATPCAASCCGTACTDTTTDPNNCGMCGTVCRVGVPECCTPPPVFRGEESAPAPSMPMCDDASQSLTNCGSCGNACEGDVPACCPSSESNPPYACTDLTSDVSNCGSCGTVCTGTAPVCCPPPPPTPVNGISALAFIPPDAGGGSASTGTCADTAHDLNNCGGCNISCLTGENAGFLTPGCCPGSALPSTNGVGTAVPPPVMCTDMSNDQNNCGSCGNVCPGNTPSCCGGTCVDMTTDINNCGFCGNVCSAPATAPVPSCCGDACCGTGGG